MTRFGKDFLNGSSAPRYETPSAHGHDYCVEAVELFGDLQTERPLARDYLLVVVGVDERIVRELRAWSRAS